MQEKCSVTEFHDRATEIRKIAQGIFDKAERKILLTFVDDCEKLAAENARADKP
jgi:hypothetical protein